MCLVSLIPPRIRRQGRSRAPLFARGCLGFYELPGLFVPTLFTNDRSTKWSTFGRVAMHARPAVRRVKRICQQLAYDVDVEISETSFLSSVPFSNHELPELARDSETQTPSIYER